MTHLLTARPISHRDAPDFATVDIFADWSEATVDETPTMLRPDFTTVDEFAMATGVELHAPEPAR